MSRPDPRDPFPRPDRFAPRHLGPRPHEQQEMLALLGASDLDDLMAKAIPQSIRWDGTLELPPARGERAVLGDLRDLARQNQVFRSYIGAGYHGTVTPAVIQRNILENPGWYTQYTPYQAEISQGRMEALLNFQTVVCDLTGMEVSNCSLLDEATAAAEAMTLTRRVLGKAGESRKRFLVSDTCHPQTVAVLQTRAEPLGIDVDVAPVAAWTVDDGVFGALVQYPDTTGRIGDFREVAASLHEAGALLVVAADPMALVLIEPPASFGADVVVGSTQRFGVPMGYGGPHAAFLATRDEYKRTLPGRMIGVSIDATGKPALRMALQTREQHIRREKATSNICTAQVLLAVMASMYAVYHGPDGLRAIATRIRGMTGVLAEALREAGHGVEPDVYFDTLAVRPDGRTAADVIAAARSRQINLRDLGDGRAGIALDETVELTDVRDLIDVFGGDADADLGALAARVPELPAGVARQGGFLTHPTFNRYHSETELLRYVHRLQDRDLSLTHSMIPLGSCTMKLNATTEMLPVTWPEFGSLHPFAPADQARGYRELHDRLARWLNEITGFAACSLQPNAGAQGEYTGLLTIRAYHRSRGQEQRDVCLIPTSAHGTNPASAIMAGMRVVAVECDADGNIDLGDLKDKAASHRDRLSALMITYPSTHGVFEATVREICDVIHTHGGQVYLDGANMNALVGLCRPGDLGADVCHLNLHKTFCIPHGGGGPGMGPICVAAHLAPFLPGHPLVETGGEQAIGPVSAAPWGSPSILPISYAYIAMMGPDGLTDATKVAILNANYVAERLEGHYDVLYTGRNGLVAHECILDVRPFKQSAGIDVADIAKRLIDYGFHAPTMSWPVAGTLMVEPTESESKAELDRFCDAMIGIRDEIRAIERGEADRASNPLKHAPHTAEVVLSASWDRPYSREQGAFPTRFTREHKFWPPVSRLNDVHGDRHVVCTCPPLEAYEEPAAS